VDRSRAVHGDVGDDPPPHEVDEQRGEPRLDDVAAEHDDDGTIGLCGGDDGRDDTAEVTRDQDVGERVEKVAQGGRCGGALRRTGKLLGANLVGASLDGNGAHRAEVDLGGGCA
jgi:hypothetical protein